MSMGVLLGIPGKVKTLLDRWTADLATETHSAFTYASSLHEARLTAARAANLDLIAAPKTWKCEEFTSNGVWTRPTGVELVYVLLVAAGGGGGASNTTYGACGGGGGQVRLVWVPVSSSTYTVTIGTGGAGGTTGNGSTGGNTSFGSIVAYGGVGGLGSQSSYPASRTLGGGMRNSEEGIFGFGSVGGAPGGLGGRFYFDGTTIAEDGVMCPGFQRGGSRGGANGGGGGGGSYGVGTAGGNSDTNGTSASANTGGGGGGAGKAASGTKTGGDGGSGYCLVMWME